MTGTFEGVGSLQFTPDNKFCYAFSGMIGVPNAETTMIEFQTEGEYLDIQVHLGSASTSGDDYIWKMYLNDILIMSHYILNTYPIDRPDTGNTFLIPPFTKVTLTMENNTDATANNWFNSINGKVHGAIEQQNLESITDDNKWASV